VRGWSPEVAQKVQVILTDDIDGGEAEETVQFALDGVTYEIDLSGGNAEALREALAAYVDAGRRVGGRSQRRGNVPKARPTAERADLSDVRAWARENGYQVSDRGRVSAEVKAAYEAAH
jgi:Lsr2